MVRMNDVGTVTVRLGDRSYDVVVGEGASAAAATLVPRSVRRIAIVSQENIPQSLIPDFDGVDVSLHFVGHGEEHKSLATIEHLCSAFARDGLTRGDLIVGVGGGMVTDVAGFAASCYHRGTPVMHVATTLLAMVDAAIGGKTGVNLPEGKNLVGAFWQPVGVVCDLASLQSLPERELRCGFGEMAKYHFIAREDLSGLQMRDRIERCIAIKGGIVAEDEREEGSRALLNYGHTLGHALEVESAYSLAHGEAVALGLLFAAHLGEVLGRIDAAVVDNHYRVVQGVYGLRTGIPPDIDIEDLLALMARDKKAAGTLTFVLDSTAGLQVVSGVSADSVRTAWTRFRDRIDNPPE